jgi:ribosome-associated heat shock protein Hsp15
LRIDRFLHCIRLVKSRTLAQAVIEEGHVRVDGRRVAKSSEEVHEGQVIALPLRGAVRVLRIRSLPQRRGTPIEARGHYEELGQASGD